ncbi:radical SAM protein [Candidatus Falkowbacteria bacterium]|nr:radical SAM protein [Candidatus Falkowbacteria bacterium]
MYAIWNLTKVCPWDCSFCCMSAIKVGQVDKGENLNFSEKVRVLEILAVHKMKIDFSGGDPLYNPENFAIVEKATEIMSRDFIDVSMTGVDFNERKLALLKKVGKVEISIDNIPEDSNRFRPKGFNLSAINILKTLIEENIFCSAVTTLYPLSADKSNLKRLYEFLCINKVSKWNILRFYPVGRGLKLSNLYIDDKETLELMDFLDSLRGGATEIIFQHSLRILRGEYQCHAAIKSIGILPNGTVTACGWALDKNSNPLPGFCLGKLPEDDFDVILERARVDLGYSERQSYCRILNHLKSQEAI